MVNSDDTNAINQGWKKSHVTHSTQSPSYDCWQGMLLQHPFPPEGGGVGSAAGGRGRATAYQQAENSRVRPSASSISIPPDTTHPYQVDALTRILDQPLSPTVAPPSSRAVSPTYLSLHFQVCLVSYQDHGEFISVFYSQDLSLEFVDFFKAARQRTSAALIQQRHSKG